MAKGAKEIGLKFGETASDFQTASDNTLEQVVMDWTNESIALMAKTIRSKSRTGGASTLAQDMYPEVSMTRNQVTVKVVTDQQYEDFIDKGVRGVKRNKAKNSPYKFKNLGTPPKMIQSFKEYIARTGMKSIKNQSGKRTRLIRKDKKKQDDLITKAAKQLAVATKIGGIEPKHYKEAAMNQKRINQLAKAVGISLGQAMKAQIIKL